MATKDHVHLRWEPNFKQHTFHRLRFLTQVGIFLTTAVAHQENPAFGVSYGRVSSINNPVNMCSAHGLPPTIASIHLQYNSSTHVCHCLRLYVSRCRGLSPLNTDAMSGPQPTEAPPRLCCSSLMNIERTHSLTSWRLRRAGSCLRLLHMVEMLDGPSVRVL